MKKRYTCSLLFTLLCAVLGRRKPAVLLEGADKAPVVVETDSQADIEKLKELGIEIVKIEE